MTIHPARFLPHSRILRVSILAGACLSLLHVAGCGQEQKAAAPPPPAVQVSDVIRKDVPVTWAWIVAFTRPR